MMHIKGLSAFPITPADAAGRVDTAALQLLLGSLTTAGVGSIGLLGSTGTYAYLSRGERRRAIEAAVDHCAGRTPLLVGIGALRTDDAVQFGLDAKAAGADAVLLAPVSYTPLTEAEVFTHVETVAAAVGLPLCLYNNPGTTHFTFSPELVARLSHLPNVVAVKNPAPDSGDAAREQIGALRAMAAPGFSVGVSVDWQATQALLAGADAWYSVASGLFPALCRPIVEAAARGDRAAAEAADARLKPLWALFAAYSSLRVIYAAVDILGLCRTAPPRPILPLDAAVHRQVAEVLRELGVT